MADFGELRKEPNFVNATGIPRDYLSDNDARLFASQLSEVIYPNQTGNGQGASGKLQFAVQGQNAYLLPARTYIRFKLTITSPNSSDYAVLKSSRTAAAIIKQMSFSLNGVPAAVENMYFEKIALMATHGANGGYVNNDMYLSEGSLVELAAAGTSKIVWDACVPVILSPFLSTALPLFLVPQNALLEIDLASIAECLAGFTAADVASAPTAYAVDNAVLIGEVIRVDSSYVDLVKQMMRQSTGKYVMKLDQWRNFQYTGAASSQLAIGLGVSSLNAVFWTSYVTPSATADKLYKSGFNSNVDASNAFNLFVDGRQINSALKQSSFACFPALNSAMSKLLNVEASSVPTRGSTASGGVYAGPGQARGTWFGSAATALAVGGAYTQSEIQAIANAVADVSFAVRGNIDAQRMTRSDYASRYFWAGYNLRRANGDDQVAMVGTPCANLLVQLGRPADGGSDQLVILCAYSAMLTIDLNGIVQIIN